MTIFDDLAAEQERLAEILFGLDEAQWMSASGAPGWTIADVVLHLAQSEEGVKATASHQQLRTGLGAVAGDTMDGGGRRRRSGWSGRRPRRCSGAVAARPAGGAGRGPRGRPGSAAAIGDRAVKPATLATTRLAEQWAHGLDITGPLGVEFPDTERLRHVAWLAHRTSPHALSVAGEPPVAARAS